VRGQWLSLRGVSPPTLGKVSRLQLRRSRPPGANETDDDAEPRMPDVFKTEIDKTWWWDKRALTQSDRPR